MSDRAFIWTVSILLGLALIVALFPFVAWAMS